MTTKNTAVIAGKMIRNPNQYKGRIDDVGRECSACGIYKLWDNFGLYARSPFGRRPKCKDCMRLDERKRRRETPHFAKKRRERLKVERPLKLKAATVRNGMRRRSVLSAPSILEIENWLLQQDMVCFYTGQPLMVDDFSVDHKIPLERGGTNSFDNLCVCTKEVNTSKGTMTANEFISLISLIHTWEDGGKKLLNRLRMAGRAFTKG
jgi:5-methylcytosine-specific restriction endonuclease McrA